MYPTLNFEPEHQGLCPRTLSQISSTCRGQEGPDLWDCHWPAGLWALLWTYQLPPLLYCHHCPRAQCSAPPPGLWAPEQGLYWRPGWYMSSPCPGSVEEESKAETTLLLKHILLFLIIGPKDTEELHICRNLCWWAKRGLDSRARKDDLPCPPEPISKTAASDSIFSNR